MNPNSINSRRRDAFTLIELIIATAVAALLVVGVYGAVVSTQREAKREAARSRSAAIRLTGLELLRADWRARVEADAEARPDGGGVLRLVTTGDALSLVSEFARASEVSYAVTEAGLVRREGTGSLTVELLLLEPPVRLEFLGLNGWSGPVPSEPLALGLVLGEGAEAERVVIR